MRVIAQSQAINFVASIISADLLLLIFIDAFELDSSKDSVTVARNARDLDLRLHYYPAQSMRSAYYILGPIHFERHTREHEPWTTGTDAYIVQRLESWEIVTKIMIYFNKTFVVIEELHPEIHAAPSRLLASGISL